MNGINLDPGLRKAFTQQTHQRLLTESTRARMAKCVVTVEDNISQENQVTLRTKIKIISHVVQEAGSAIVTILRAKEHSASA